MTAMFLAFALVAAAPVAAATPPTHGNGAALLARAEASGRREDYAAAERSLEAAYRAGAHGPATVRDLASVYGRIGKIEAAAGLLLKTLASQPDAAGLHDKLGYLYRYAGLPEQSIAAYRRAQELAADDAGLIDSEGQIAKARIYLGDIDGARASHRRVRALAARARAPIDEKMLFYEGMVEVYAGRKRAAARLFDQSLARAPASLWSAFAQAYKAGVLGRRDDLLARAAKLETGNVSDGERRYRLVHLYAMAGDRPRALRHLRGAIDAGFFNHPYIADDRLTAGLHAMPEFKALKERARARRARFITLLGTQGAKL